MFKQILISFLLLVHGVLSAQSHNYLKLRDDLNIRACGAIDSSMVYGSIRKLEAFDTTHITKNLEQYYLDLSMNYWLASGGSDETFLRKSIRSCHAALYHNPNYAPTHWNMAMSYAMLNECELAIKHLDLCFLYTKEKQIDTYTLEESRKLRERCGQ